MKYLKKFIYIVESRFDNTKYKNYYTSDLIRMKLFDIFFNNIKSNPLYNIEVPNNFKLIDEWDGYDDQVYIQNNISENEFIYWEGWVTECWKAAYEKIEYKGLSKVEIIEKIIKDRFPKIGQEFGLKIKNYSYFKYKGKYIMKIVFTQALNENIQNDIYIYHGTSKGQALSIQRDGVMKLNNTGEVKPSVSFTKKIDYAKYYARAKGSMDNMVILRTVLNDKFKLSPRIRNNKGDEYISFDNIYTSNLEILTNDGSWQPFEKWNIIFDELL